MSRSFNLFSAGWNMMSNRIFCVNAVASRQIMFVIIGDKHLMNIKEMYIDCHGHI